MEKTCVNCAKECNKLHYPNREDLEYLCTFFESYDKILVERLFESDECIEGLDFNFQLVERVKPLNVRVADISNLNSEGILLDPIREGLEYGYTKIRAKGNKLELVKDVIESQHQWALRVSGVIRELLKNKDLRAKLSGLSEEVKYDNEYEFDYEKITKEALEDFIKEYQEEILRPRKRESKSSYKPKFKVGDWIIREFDEEHRNLYCVIGISDDNRYLLKSQNGNSILFNTVFIDTAYRHWCINDARKGDILIEDKNGEYYNLLIFKASYIKSPENFESFMYIYLQDKSGNFDFNVLGSCVLGNKNHSTKGVRPATHEECLLLKEQMSEKNWVWDKEKKCLIIS